MHEHLPTLLTRISTLVRHANHLYNGLLRSMELGLLRIPKVTRVFSRSDRDSASSARRLAASLNSNGTDQASGKELIISVHIPKTGGTTFLEVLRASVQDLLFLDYGVGIEPTGLYRKGNRVATEPGVIPDFASVSGRSVIHGHFRTGKYLPKFPNATYVTWLRDPVERLASHYFFWQRTPFMEDPLCNKVISEKMTLEDFASLEIARNVQHRFLMPMGVEGFAFVGITEEYERSLELFRRLICPDVEIVPTMQNTNPDRSSSLYELDPGVRERILQLNELDVATYASGLRRFHCLCKQAGV